jgi:hypothetical protein
MEANRAESMNRGQRDKLTMLFIVTELRPRESLAFESRAGALSSMESKGKLQIEEFQD